MALNLDGLMRSNEYEYECLDEYLISILIFRELIVKIIPFIVVPLFILVILIGKTNLRRFI